MIVALPMIFTFPPGGDGLEHDEQLIDGKTESRIYNSTYQIV